MLILAKFLFNLLNLPPSSSSVTLFFHQFFHPSSLFFSAKISLFLFFLHFLKELLPLSLAASTSTFFIFLIIFINRFLFKLFYYVFFSYSTRFFWYFFSLSYLSDKNLSQNSFFKFIDFSSGVE